MCRRCRGLAESLGRRISCFLPPAAADFIERAIMSRSAPEEEWHRRTLAKLEDVLLEQGLAKEKEFVDNQDAWRREKKAQDDIYVDLVSND